MTMDAEQFRRAYAEGLETYLRDPGEEGLHAAYELGRRAVEGELTVLELAAAQNEHLLGAVRSAEDGTDAERVARAAGDFFMESLSAFEMVRRGFREARDIVLLERRHAAMLRQLSNFLADASLATNAPDSVHEVLTLVAEHARELVGVECALAAVQLSADGGPIVAASFPDGDAHWTGFLDRQQSRERWFQAAAGTAPGWLAAPITALDGRQLGSIQLFDKTNGGFAEVDEAVLAHLAQMASAAIERAQSYEQRGDGA